MTAMKVPFMFLITCLTIIFVTWGGECIWYKRSTIRIKELKLRDNVMKMAMSHRRNKPLTPAIQISHQPKFSVVTTIPLKDIVITLPPTNPVLPGVPLNMADGRVVPSPTSKSKVVIICHYCYELRYYDHVLGDSNPCQVIDVSNEKCQKGDKQQGKEPKQQNHH